MMRTEPVLLLDLGNTRLKWQLVQDSQVRAQGHGSARCLDDLRADSPVMDQLNREVIGSQRETVTVPVIRVFGGAVGAPAVRAWLTDWFNERHGISVSWVCSRASIELTTPDGVIGLRQPYAEPERLGVDRWLAALGLLGLLARRQWPRPGLSWQGIGSDSRRLALVSAGTATVVDGLVLRQQDGQIQAEMSGGLIYPGFELMRSVLAAQTADLANYVVAARNHVVSPQMPTNSIAAIGAGIAAAQVGAVDWLGPIDGLVVHGGHAQDWLEAYAAARAASGQGTTDSAAQASQAPDLVLTGLSLLAESSEGSRS
jgi:pantothenate kinase type III